MESSYYQEFLYPLQDRILSLISDLNLPFYLTGGTALSRHYLSHRYSDDLDFFVNSHTDFKTLIIAIEAQLRQAGIDYNTLTRSDDFIRLEVLAKDNTHLKLDFVNDLVIHLGGYESSGVLGRVDNVMNILSNKISAIPRLEIKDFADIVYIARKYEFVWDKVIGEAIQKDEWVNPLDLARYIVTTEIDRFKQIQWITTPDYQKLEQDCQIIADDIIYGRANSLAGS